MHLPASLSATCWCATLLFAGKLLGASAPDAPLERQPLFSADELKRWSPAESQVQVSTQVTREVPDSLHWQITVDYEKGEPNYPIGWPRISRAIPAGPLRDWTDWDYLQCWVFVATARESLPAIPAGLGLHTPDRAGAYQRTLAELKAREWVLVKIPIVQIPRHHDVRQIQFHIAELNYRDGDRLDFYFNDLALVRHAVPTILAFSAESAVAFTDARQIPLHLHLAGIPSGSRADVTVEMRQTGQVTVRRTLAAARGAQSYPFELAAADLNSGEYELRAQISGQTASTSARIRVVASPWH